MDTHYIHIHTPGYPTVLSIYCPFYFAPSLHPAILRSTEAASSNSGNSYTLTPRLRIAHPFPTDRTNMYPLEPAIDPPDFSERFSPESHPGPSPKMIFMRTTLGRACFTCPGSCRGYSCSSLRINENDVSGTITTGLGVKLKPPRVVGTCVTLTHRRIPICRPPRNCT